MKKSIWKIMGIIALLVVVFFIGFKAGQLSKEKTELTRGAYVSKQPITLVAFDFKAKNLSQYSYVRNLAGGGDTGNLSIKEFEWIQNKGINVTNLSIEMIKVGFNTSKNIFFPSIASIDWIMDKSLLEGDNVNIEIGKKDFMTMFYDVITDSEQHTVQKFNISFNTTAGWVNITFLGNVSQNATSNRTYYRLVLDNSTGEVSLIARSAENCNLKDTIYSTTITPFNYSKSSGAVVFKVKSLKGLIIEKIGLHQNALSGAYESQTIEHCYGNFVSP